MPASEAQVTRSHERAMELAERAMLARARGELGEYRRLIEKAFAAEKEAALLFANSGLVEPSRSVLLQSAASLGAECEKPEEAAELVRLALQGEPPPDVKVELMAMARNIAEMLLPDRSEPESECQAQRSEGESWGYQLIVDCFGVPFDLCKSLEHAYDFIDRLARFLQLTKQTQPYVFRTCEMAFPGRPGISGWVPLIESGIQIHTSAHNHFVTVDIYSERLFDEESVVKVVKSWYYPAQIDTCYLLRGKDIGNRTRKVRNGQSA